MKYVVFINSHPIQYFAPLYQEIAATSNILFEVIYCDDATLKGERIDKGFGSRVKWDIPLLSGYNSTFIHNNSFGLLKKSNGFFSIINFGIIGYLYRKPPSIIIIPGWQYFSYVLTIVVAKLFGHKTVLRGETPLNQEKKKNKVITFIKHIYLRFLFLFVDKLLFIGKQNKLFYSALGIKSKNLFFAPYGVDNKRFRSIFEKTSLVEARNQVNISPNSKMILFSGKYILKKRPMDLLKSFLKLSSHDVLLVFVGEGELRTEMENFIKLNRLQDSVILTGFINQSIIPLYYRAADLFVMCSGLGETWGLSVNEAMNFGLPVIVSDTCGSAYDLVKNGVNGRVFETGNIQQLTECLEEFLLKNEDERKRIEVASLEIVDQYSYKQTINSLEILASDNWA